MDIHQQLWIFVDVLIASGLTLFVGYEREKANKPAGIRTNMIIGGASTLIVSIALPLVNFLNNSLKNGLVETDPVRIIQALVIGVSFVGAGTVLKSAKNEKVEGLTTAATLLYSCGIGICVALKQYILAVLVTALIVTVNFIINYIAKKFTDIK